MHLRLVEPTDGLDSPRACRGAFGHDLIPGLPTEFCGAVLAESVARLRTAGTVIVDRAAYDPVESSEAAFSAATRLLIASLTAGDDATEDDLRDRLQKVVRSIGLVR